MSLQASEALPLEPPVQKWGRWIGVALGMGIFALALFALREQFATYNVREIRNAMRDLDTPFIVRATLYAIAAYAVLELSFNHHLMAVSSATAPDLAAVKDLEFWARLISGLGLSLWLTRALLRRDRLDEAVEHR